MKPVLYFPPQQFAVEAEVNTGKSSFREAGLQVHTLYKNIWAQKPE